MTTGSGFSAYIDVATYLRAATNQETASLLGLNTTLTASVAAGATMLPVGASANWAAGTLWLLDGPSSEVVQVLGAADATHLTLAAPGTQLVHAAGVSASQAGSAGALAETIARASGWIESYCQQGAGADRSLFALSRTERWGMPGSRAWLDRDGVLAVRPGHFPVQSVAALSIESGAGTAWDCDVSRLEIPSSGRLVEAPLLVASAGGAQLPSLLSLAGLSRAHRHWIVLTYVGGIAVGSVPYDVQQACIWVTSDLLAQRKNPTGAAVVKMGKFELQARPRVDPTGDSLLVLHAKAALEPYRSREM